MRSPGDFFGELCFFLHIRMLWPKIKKMPEKQNQVKGLKSVVEHQKMFFKPRQKIGSKCDFVPSAHKRLLLLERLLLARKKKK